MMTLHMTGLSMVNFEDYFVYDPEGCLRWKQHRGMRGKEGKKAGSERSRYSYVQLFGKLYSVHGVVWYLHKGTYPDYSKDQVIDHIDGDTKNNRIENLRLATTSQNQQNTKIRVDNTSGVKGVSFIPRFNKWCARININKKRTLIGYFKTLEEAKEARLQAEEIYYPYKKL